MDIRLLLLHKILRMESINRYDGSFSTGITMDRRSYLKLAGSAAAGAALATGSVSAYDQTIDVVKDLGVDNTGSTPIDDEVQPYVDDNTRLEFPDGRYRIGQLITYGVENFQLVGTGDATLVPGSKTSSVETWIGGSFVRDLTFEGFTLDTEGYAPTVGFGAHSGLVVKDIEKVGAQANSSTAFGFAIWEEDGVGLIDNLQARDGDVFEDSVGATCVYHKGRGNTTFRNCKIEGWSDNGLYACDAKGSVTVLGGYYANNNISQVRLGSAGSTVQSARIRVDEPRGPNSNMRGVRISDGGGPVDVVDCDIEMRRGQGSGGVVTAFTGGTTNVRDSRIHVHEDYTTVGSPDPMTSYGILADTPSEVDDYAGLTVINTSITGSGTGGAGILSRRGNTVVKNACIQQDGTSREGVVFQTNLGGNAVEDSTIDVTGKTVVKNGADVSVSDIETSGSCPLPETLQSSSSSSSSASSSSSSSSSSSGLDLTDLPLPAGSQDRTRPITGTDPSNPTAVIYTQYTEPAMESFVGANFQRLVDDFVRPGRLNLELRNVPTSSDTRFLSAIGLGVWDLEPENYFQFLEHVLENQQSIEYGSVSAAQSMLDDAGVRNNGWIPWRAKTGVYSSAVAADEGAAADWGMVNWDDFPPILAFDGEVAAPQYSYEGGIKAWLERRL